MKIGYLVNTYPSPSHSFIRREVQALERVCVIFDGNDPAALDIARGQWKALTDAGCAAQYWSEESGRWEKKAERGA